LPHGKARVDEVARKLGVSQRTLARRLSSEGLTFAVVVQRLKFDLAKRHLADDALSISEIAWLLGYHDISAFTDAFKRWTGRTPRAMRRGEVTVKGRKKRFGNEAASHRIPLTFLAMQTCPSLAYPHHHAKGNQPNPKFK